MIKNSIIIPTKDESYIFRCLESLPKTSTSEIIVIDDFSSSEDYSKILKEYCLKNKIRYKKNDRPGLTANRNEGLKEAKGENVLYIDADCISDKNWMKEMDNSLKDFDLVAGKVDYDSAIRKPFERIIQNSEPNMMGATFAVKRKLFPSLKFDEHFFFREETDFYLRVKEKGLKFYFNNNAKVYHKPSRYTVKKFILERKKYYGEVLFFKNHRKDKELSHFVSHIGRVLYPQELFFVILIPLSLFFKFRLIVFPLLYLIPGLMFIARNFKKRKWSFNLKDFIILLFSVPLTMFVKRFAIWKGIFMYKYLVF